MRSRTVQLAAMFACVAITIGSLSAQSRGTSKHRTATPKAAARKPPTTPKLPCGDYLGFQVLLDRQGFSPGEIDGHAGPNLSHALSALQTARSLSVTGEPDCDTWHALGADQAGELIATYTIRQDDVDRTFTERIPADLVEQAKLPSLNYRSPLELLGEKFHASPALLQRLNPGLQLKAGTVLRVPATQPFDASAKPAAPQKDDLLTIAVSKEDSALRAVRADGSVAFFAPVTTGSEHDPLPVGDWKIVGTRWLPAFHYNPKLFWDADPGDTRATIKPGPNNPVGVVWISIDVEHYGLHGTPEPSRVGHTASHGCVRLTNWDAARLASLVRPGTPVQFR